MSISLPSCCSCDTCSTIEARRPSAQPHWSSRVITADPSLTTMRLAFLSSVRVSNAFFSELANPMSLVRSMVAWMARNPFFPLCTRRTTVVENLRRLDTLSADLANVATAFTSPVVDRPTRFMALCTGRTFLGRTTAGCVVAQRETTSDSSC